jgi:hypothetical protein
MTDIDYLNEPPSGWFVLDITRRDENPRGRDWTALMVDVDPDELKNKTMSVISRRGFMFTPTILAFVWHISAGSGSLASTEVGRLHGSNIQTARAHL